MPHICLILADVGYRGYQPASAIPATNSRAEAIRTSHSLFVRSRIAKIERLQASTEVRR